LEHPHPQPSSKITTLQQAFGNHRLHTREAALEKPKACERQVPCEDDTAAQLRPRFSLAVFSCHSKAAGFKRNWDSSSASYASRPWQTVVLCTKMAQGCKLSDDIEILTHFAIRQESMLDCSFLWLVNYDVYGSESVETRDSMHVPRPTRDWQRQCSAPVWASPSSPMRAHFP